MSRAVLQVFDQYERARTQFVQTVAELAVRPQNIEALQNASVMALLRPLLLDTVPGIQQSAALALGRLANYSEQLAEAVVGNEVLPQLVHSLKQQNRFYKRAAAFVLRAVAKHSPELAQAVVDEQALDPLAKCLAEFEPSVKEAAAWAIGYIARHNAELAQAVVDSGAVGNLVMCVQEHELTLKRIAVSALSEIAKHSPELAHAVVDQGAVTCIAPLIAHPDSKLKRQACSVLAQIAKHSMDLAEVVVEAEVFPKILLCLKDEDEVVRRNAATCIREIAKHTAELATLIVNAGGHGSLLEYIAASKGDARLPALMTIGYIAAFSETLAFAIIQKQGVLALKDALVQEQEDHIKAAAAWALCQVGRHTPEHARALATADVFRALIDCFKDEKSSPDLKLKCKNGLKTVLQKCVYLPALEPLMKDAPEKVMKYLVMQFAKVLPNNPEARKSFVTSGCLQKVLEIKAEDGSKLKENINLILQCFPTSVVQYYSPQYPQELLKQLDEVERKA